MARIYGAKEHRARLRRMASPEVARLITQALYTGGQEIEIEAERLITSGSISGKGHIPSLPGEPPNADTRELDTSIETKIISQTNPTVHVEAFAPHALPLEVGTSKMAARPFMKPATEAKREDVINKLRSIIPRILR